MMRVHVDGTRRVLEAAKARGRASRGARVDVGHHRRLEASPKRSTRARRTPTEIVSGWPYYLSKIYQERLALDLGATWASKSSW